MADPTSRPHITRTGRCSSGADGLASGDLGPSSSTRQLLQPVLERKLRLHSVPASRHLFLGRLPAIDLHPEAFEAERPRTILHWIVGILEAVTCFPGATSGA